jgi:hypothetical protein
LDDWLMKHYHLVARSTGSICIDCLMKPWHLVAKSLIRVEVGSNTSTLRVVRGDEMRIKKAAP